MNYSEIAAWWGAIIATYVFIWDIYKWFHSGSKLFVITRPLLVRTENYDDEHYINVEITNVGTSATTLKHLCVVQYNNRFSFLLNKPLNTHFIPPPNSLQTLPRLLEPGVMWSYRINRSILLQNQLNHGLWYCIVFDSSHKKGTYSRIKFNL